MIIIYSIIIPSIGWLILELIKRVYWKGFSAGWDKGWNASEKDFVRADILKINYDLPL